MIARYTLFYAGMFIAASILMFTIYTVFDLPGSNGASIAMIMVTAVISGQIFAREQLRAPTPRERHQLAGAFTAAGVVISMVQFGLVMGLAFSPMERQLLMQELTNDMINIMLGVTAVVLAILYGITWLGLGMGSKGMLKQQAKKKAKSQAG